MNGSIPVPVSLATDLIERLAAAGVTARVMDTELGTVFGGDRTDMAHVLVDTTEPAVVNEVLAAFRLEHGDIRTSRRCPSCDYDLKGHVGHDLCPECGHEIHAPSPDVDCDGCGEPVPLHFEVCWSCGKDLEGLE